MAIDAPALDGSGESGGGAAWLYRLLPSARYADLLPASALETVAEATACLGPDPVGWAVGLGHDMAARITAEIPELGGGQGPFETLRMGTESSALCALLMLADPCGRAPITDEALQGDRDFVRRGVSLDKVLRGIRLGHADMAHAMMNACEALAPPEERAGQMRRVSDTLFRFIDGFSSRMTEEYVAEHDRWVTSRAAARQEAVRAILAGEPVGAEAAGRTLGYPLTREHLAITVWCDPMTGPDTTDLQQAAVDFLRRQGCTVTLVVPTGRTGLWAWGSLATPRASTDGHVVPLGREDVRIACGSFRPGVAGFRDSHEEALRAARVARLNPRPGTSVLHYRDVEVVALLSNDLPGARRFVRDELGPLAEDTPQAEQLRETLRHYLQAERSLMAAAEQMHVARNTVTYRVKRAQHLLGHDIARRRFEVHAALETAHLLGSAVLGPAGSLRSAG
ncbi:PucR family transcriptional regulator [Streptacidiphilus sp. PAMC 29251]